MIDHSIKGSVGPCGPLHNDPIIHEGRAKNMGKQRQTSIFQVIIATSYARYLPTHQSKNLVENIIWQSTRISSVSETEERSFNQGKNGRRRQQAERSHWQDRCNFSDRCIIINMWKQMQTSSFQGIIATSHARYFPTHQFKNLVKNRIWQSTRISLAF